MEKFEEDILKAQSDHREAIINSFNKEEVKTEVVKPAESDHNTKE